MNRIRFEVPIKTASTSNLREHWAAKHKRTDAQKAATRRRCPEWTAGALLYVRLTRVAPRALDDDNLRGALKSVRDAVASWLRVDDRSPLVGWLYEQAKGPTPLVRVEVDARPLGVESELGPRPSMRALYEAVKGAPETDLTIPVHPDSIAGQAIRRLVEERGFIDEVIHPDRRPFSLGLGVVVTPAYQKAQTDAVVPKRRNLLGVKCECGHARGDHTSGRGVCMKGPCECCGFAADGGP